MANSKPRIWELDALRGVCILCVIVVHFLFDLSFFGGLDLTLPAWYVFIQEYGGAIFVVLSGVCVTLGSKSVRRGLIVFACGMLITAVTYGMYRLGMSGADVVVKFGVLHLLGVCMLVYPAFKKLPPAALALLGLAIAITGYAIRGVVVPQHWLFPLGLTYEGFTSSDYFPLFPQLGYFLIGAAIGKTAYREKRTFLPGAFQQTPVARFFCWCGRQSLFIYLLHQPIVYGLLEFVLLLRG
ncbi:MAG: heparan-alpha-glucosaminide N-acetyltransferase [Oscillospiraceae bacterium]